MLCIKRCIQHFKLNQVIWRVVENLLIKAATAPFALLGSMFGGGGEELGQVDFADLCITSGITIRSDAAPEGAFALADVPGVAVVFQPAVGQKCERCWQILPDVGTHKHPATCQRCNDALG